MKIYTKTGDKGETSLGGGKRLKKNSVRINAYGEIDELNAVIGIVRSLKIKNTSSLKYITKIVAHIQKDLFILGADLASPKIKKVGGKIVPRITKTDVEKLENWIDEMDTRLPELKNFIAPGGNLLAGHLHVARTICRRAERSLISLHIKEPVPSEILEYTNRLSDLLFTLARYANFSEGTKEEKMGN